MILPGLIALLSLAAFMAVLGLSGIVPLARRAIGTATAAAAALRDPALDDAAREKASQAAAIALFGAFAGLLLRSALALGAAALPLLAADAAGLLPLDAAIGFLSRWDVILVLSLAGIALWIAGARAWPSR